MTSLQFLSDLPKTDQDVQRLNTWVSALRTLADTIRLLSDQGAAIDAEALAAQIGLPLRSNAKEGPLFAYHIQSGCFTINEVRASTGRGPTPDGERLAGTSAGGAVPVNQGG